MIINTRMIALTNLKNSSYSSSGMSSVSWKKNQKNQNWKIKILTLLHNTTSIVQVWLPNETDVVELVFEFEKFSEVSQLIVRNPPLLKAQFI